MTRARDEHLAVIPAYNEATTATLVVRAVRVKAPGEFVESACTRVGKR